MKLLVVEFWLFIMKHYFYMNKAITIHADAHAQIYSFGQKYAY